MGLGIRVGGWGRASWRRRGPTSRWVILRTCFGFNNLLGSFCKFTFVFVNSHLLMLRGCRKSRRNWFRAAAGDERGIWFDHSIAAARISARAGASASRTSPKRQRTACDRPEPHFVEFEATKSSITALRRSAGGRSPCDRMKSWKRCTLNLGPRAFSAAERISRSRV